MRALFLAIALSFAGYVAWQHFFLPPLGYAITNAEDASRPLVVKIHADSCPTCVELGPTWTRLDAQAGASARLVVLDVTDETRSADTKRIARYLGLGDFLQQHMQQTGMIAVLHGATRAQIAVFQGERDVSEYLEAIAKARSG